MSKLMKTILLHNRNASLRDRLVKEGRIRGKKPRKAKAQGKTEKLLRKIGQNRGSGRGILAQRQ